ncbi:hypothetical protein [Neobacillus sp. LXY-4]|uniref:hypothetical protein n=1 Tax=Neobacillus sp. LXY-4 TaxID=3379826 RepID=UPI003EE335EE
MYFQIMFYGGLAGAVITLAISIFVYIKMNITQVIEHLTGVRFHKKNKKQQRVYIRKLNESGKRTTNEIRIRKKVVEQDRAWSEAVAATELMNERLEETALLHDEYCQETSLLSGELDETCLLTRDQETTLLSGLLEEDPDESFKKEIDIMIVHAETII